jgi:hypothetical protein
LLSGGVQPVRAVIRALVLRQIDGPDIQIEFTDGTRFSACLKTVVSIEATYSQDQGGQPHLPRDYSSRAIPL